MMGSLPADRGHRIPINGLFVMGLTLLITAVVCICCCTGRAGACACAPPSQNRAMSGAVGINTAPDRPPHLRARLRHRRRRRRAFTTIGSTGPTSGSALHRRHVPGRGLRRRRRACSARSPRRFGIAQAQSTLEFFLTGSMAKVLTLLLVIVLLMIRPQGLFVRQGPKVTDIAMHGRSMNTLETRCRRSS